MNDIYKRNMYSIISWLGRGLTASLPLFSIWFKMEGNFTFSNVQHFHTFFFILGDEVSFKDNESQSMKLSKKYKVKKIIFDSTRNTNYHFSNHSKVFHNKNSYQCTILKSYSYGNMVDALWLSRALPLRIGRTWNHNHTYH